MIARYETLRRQVLDGVGMQSQGMALFVRRGMVAWMQAWSQCAVPLVSPATAPSPAPDDHELCPVQLHDDVATLLASMVLFIRQEAIAC